MSLLLLFGGPTTPTVTATAAGSWGGVSASAGDTQFNPLSLSPNIWLDASDTSTITTGAGGLVNTWADKSGNGKDITRSSGTGVNSGLTTLNGKNLIDFTTASKVFRASTAADWKFLTDGTPTIIAMVVKPATTDSPGTVTYPILSVGQFNIAYNTFLVVWSNSTTAGQGNRIRTFAANGTGFVVQNISSGSAMQANRFAALTVFHDGDASPASARSSIYVNDGSAITNNTSTGAVSTSDPHQPLTLGYSINSGFFAGSIAEIVIVSGVNATDANREALYKYLRTKWMYPAVITQESATASSSFGAVTATVSATVTPAVRATAAGSWGAWSASSSASPTVFASGASSFGAISATASATKTINAAGAGVWGDTASTALSEVIHPATATGTWGAATNTATATVTVPASADGTFGSWVAASTAEKTVYVYAASAWFGDLHAYASPWVIAFPLGEFGGWSGTVSASKTVYSSGASSFGEITAQATATVEVSASGSLSGGSWSGTSSAVVTHQASASLTPSGTLTASASKTVLSTGALTQDQSVTASAVVSHDASASGIFGGVVGSAAPTVEVPASSAISVTPSLTAAATVTKLASASLSGALTATAIATATGGAVTATGQWGQLVGSSTAVVTVNATGSTSASGTFTGSAVVTKKATASSTWTSSLSASAKVSKQVAGAGSWGLLAISSSAKVTKLVAGSSTWNATLTASAIKAVISYSRTYTFKNGVWQKALPKQWNGTEWVIATTAKVWDSEHSQWIPLIDQPS